MNIVIEWLADSLITGSVVISIVLAIRVLIVMRAPRRYAYILWAVVGLRLLVPVSIPSPVSVFNLIPDVRLGSENSLRSDTNISDTETEIDDNLQKSGSDAAGKSASEKEAYRASDVEKTAESKSNAVEQTSINKSDTVKRTETSLARPADVSQRLEPSTDENKGVWMYALFVVWLVVAGVFFSKNIVDSVRLHKRLRTAVRREGDVYESDRIDTPFVRGVIRPRIYIPFRLSEDELRCVLAHERHHIHRGDAAFKLVAVLIVTLYWFHPLVWLSYRLMVRDMEMSCDEYVLSHEDGDIRAIYSTLLLAFATNRRIADGVLFFGENDTKRRVKHIMKFKRSSLLAGALAILAVCVVCVGCLTSAKGTETDTSVSASGSAVSGESVDSSELSEAEFLLPNGSVIEGETIELTTPDYATWQSTGADGVEIIYVDKNKLILTGYFGLFVYDKNEQKITRELDRIAIGCGDTQGDEYTDIRASQDGSQVYLHSMTSKDSYIYDVETDKLLKAKYSELEKNNIDFYRVKKAEGAGTILYDADGEKRYVESNTGDWYIGSYCFREYGEGEEPLVQDYHAVFLDEKYSGARLLHFSEIQNINKVEMFIGDGMRTVIDPTLLASFESRIKSFDPPGRADDFSGCPFDRVMYLTMEDGTFGMIYPATDDCGTFITADGEYYSSNWESSIEDNLCKLLQWSDVQHYGDDNSPVREMDVILEDMDGGIISYRLAGNQDEVGVSDPDVANVFGYGKKRTVKLADSVEYYIYSEDYFRETPTHSAFIYSPITRDKFRDLWKSKYMEMFDRVEDNESVYYTGKRFILSVENGKCVRISDVYQA